MKDVYGYGNEDFLLDYAQPAFEPLAPVDFAENPFPVSLPIIDAPQLLDVQPKSDPVYTITIEPPTEPNAQTAMETKAQSVEMPPETVAIETPENQEIMRALPIESYELLDQYEPIINQYEPVKNLLDFEVHIEPANVQQFDWNGYPLDAYGNSIIPGQTKTTPQATLEQIAANGGDPNEFLISIGATHVETNAGEVIDLTTIPPTADVLETIQTAAPTTTTTTKDDTVYLNDPVLPGDGEEVPETTTTTTTGEELLFGFPKTYVYTGGIVAAVLGVMFLTGGSSNE